MILTDSEGHGFELRDMNCPTCGTSGKRVLGYRGGRFQRYRMGVETRIVQCDRCSLIFPDPFPFPLNPQQLYADPDKYFEHFDETEVVAAYRKLIQRITRECGKKDYWLLDVGSGRAELLRAAQQEAVNAVGLDISDSMIHRAREQFGIELLPYSIEEFVTKSERMFDAVVLNAVLEHVYDPDSMIAAVARITRSRGILYINVPQEPNLLTLIGNSLNKLVGSKAIYNLQPTWPPYHVFGFNRRSLGMLLNKHGFEVASVKVHATPKVYARPEIKDQIKAFVATQINRIANYTGTASNMYVWAYRR